MVAVTYVRDIDRSRAFYELLGFGPHSSGAGPASGWLYLQQGSHFVLLATTRPPLDIPALPLLFYFFVADLDAQVAAIRAAGTQADHLGYPPHALGGEVRVLDPDGNTVLLGQAERLESQPPAEEPDSPHFSFLKEAADLVRAAARPRRAAGCAASAGFRARTRPRSSWPIPPGTRSGPASARRRDPGDRARRLHRQPGRGHRRVHVHPGLVAPAAGIRPPRRGARRRPPSGPAGWRWSSARPRRAPA